MTKASIAVACKWLGVQKVIRSVQCQHITQILLI